MNNNIELNGLETAIQEYFDNADKCKGPLPRMYRCIMLDLADGEIWCDVELVGNWKRYHSDSIINLISWCYQTAYWNDYTERLCLYDYKKYKDTEFKKVITEAALTAIADYNK